MRAHSFRRWPCFAIALATLVAFAPGCTSEEAKTEIVPLHRNDARGRRRLRGCAGYAVMILGAPDVRRACDVISTWLRRSDRMWPSTYGRTLL
jgi:hypothetical protein